MTAAGGGAKAGSGSGTATGLGNGTETERGTGDQAVDCPPLLDCSVTGWRCESRAVERQCTAHTAHRRGVDGSKRSRSRSPHKSRKRNRSRTPEKERGERARGSVRFEGDNNEGRRHEHAGADAHGGRPGRPVNEQYLPKKEEEEEGEQKPKKEVCPVTSSGPNSSAVASSGACLCTWLCTRRGTVSCPAGCDVLKALVASLEVSAARG